MEDNPITPSLEPAIIPAEVPMAAALYKVFHPTDLSPASDIAFAHALKLALAARGELRIMHVDPDLPETDWSSLPRVRETLAQWGVLPEGSSKRDVTRLGLHIEKILAYHEEPTRSLEQHLKRHPADLLVLATYQPDAIERLISKPVAEPLARHTRIPTLFIPDGAQGFVDLQDGSVHLHHIVIPITKIPAPHAAVDAATRLAKDLQQSNLRFTLLHVGTEGDLPAVEAGALNEPGWDRHTTMRDGDVVEAIIEEAEQADLVVMATEGPHGLLDALLGSTTEQVLRRIRRPLLAIPA